MEPGPEARARGFRLLALDEVDSTNDEARRLIETGERGPLWIVAARQTMGRGRVGREWQSRPGNLFASLILSNFGATATAPQLGFVTGVAAMRALKDLAPAPDIFRLKWPNDLLMRRAKLGGVLLEGVSVPTGDARVPFGTIAIVGIGVNVADAPRNLPYPATSLREIGAGAPSAQDLFARLTDAFVETLDLWRGGAGFAQLREEWLRHAAGIGEEVAIVLANETALGVFETIDPLGRLVLSTPAGPRVIDAGDVVIGPRRAGAAA